MEKSNKGFRLIFFCTILFLTFTFYNCGGEDEDSSTNSLAGLSRINGHVTDVIVRKYQPDKSVYAKLVRFIEVVKKANAQGLSLSGITVIALQLEGGEEIFVDEDITDQAGSFSLDVQAGEIILQFIIGDDFFESKINVPEETTLEIFVKINSEDPENPVEISEIVVIDDEDEEEGNDLLDDSQSGDFEGDDIGDGGSQTGDDDDDNQGEDAGNQNGDDDDDNQGEDAGSQTGDDDDDNQGEDGGSQAGDDDDDTDQGGGIDDPPSGNGEITSSEMLLSVNSRRAQGADCGSEGVFGPQSLLSVNAALGQAALRHSNDMASLDFFGHTGSDGSNPVQRMIEEGFSGNAWGENISRSTNQRTAEQVVAGWMTSDGHCANIMAPIFSKMGSARANSASWEYWTLDLGN